MNTFEFQFRWGGKRACFGIDVFAGTVEDAVTKANRFFQTDEGVRPAFHPDAKRLWVHAAAPVTSRSIGSIYGPLEDDDPRNFTVARWRRLYETECSLCHRRCLRESAHLHRGKGICDEHCWDDRLKASE